jgi:hypothetical protein
MKQARFSIQFVNSFQAAPDQIQKKFHRRLGHLLSDLRHPSLHAKKYDASDDIWQARIDDNWRFVFASEATPTSWSILCPIPNRVLFQPSPIPRIEFPLTPLPQYPKRSDLNASEIPLA